MEPYGKSSMSMLDTRVLSRSLPSWTLPRGCIKAGRGTIELVEGLGSATEHGSVRAVPEVSKMPCVPRDIYRAAADGTYATRRRPLGVGTPYAHRRSERVDLATRADGAAPVSARNRSLVVRGPAPGPSGTPPGPERATRRRRVGSRSRRPGDWLSRSAEWGAGTK